MVHGRDPEKEQTKQKTKTKQKKENKTKPTKQNKTKKCHLMKQCSNENVMTPLSHDQFQVLNLLTLRFANREPGTTLNHDAS